MKVAWETLCNVTKHDLGLALKTGRIPPGDECIAVKKRIEEAEELNKDAPGTMLAFAVLRGVRSDCDECLNVRERTEPGIFNVSLIELGDKCEKSEGMIPMRVINVHKEHGHNVDGTTHVEGETDNETEAMERLNEF